jgi:hypothetical protein
MDIEFISKVVAVAASVLALYKVLVEFARSKKPQLREDFKFTKEFLAELTPDTHPYIVEKGYHAITGDGKLGASEIRYLLTLPSPSLALRRYSSARELLVFSASAAEARDAIAFKPKYSSHSKRKWLKRFYVALYAIFATLAFLPIAFALDILKTNGLNGLFLISFAIVAFGPLAVTFLYSYGQFIQAEDVVRQQ